MNISPLAPATSPALSPIEGATLAVAETGIRYRNRPDVLLVELCPGTTVAGVFTQSKVVAAPVTWCRSLLKRRSARALVVNAGNANACTGKEGMQSVKRTAFATAKALGCKAEDVFIASTGVIGGPLPDQKITDALPALKRTLAADGWHDAARAIMTTDTFFKVATKTVKIGSTQVRINGIAKGSGMIGPNMATLLVFIFTDAKIPAPVLQRLVSEANARTFNCTTVDGDASTNDTLLAFATGKAKHPAVTSVKDAKLKAFAAGLHEVLLDLAIQVVKDGEGAQKLVTIDIEGAANDRAARTIGLTIANSPLVKTAIAGEDANWGRVLAAAGRAGEKVLQDKIRLSIGGFPVTKAGARVPGYDETPVAAHMKGQDIRIRLNLGIGKGKATVYTCDLTHGYIDINGSYRT